MSKREPKSRHTTTIEIVSRPGERKGWIELGTGNVTYYRSSAKTSTLILTYQQLVALFEKEIEYREINENKIKLPKPHPNGDFVLNFSKIDVDDSEYSLLSSRLSINKIDPRHIDLGNYQFSHYMANGRKSKKYSWFAHVSVQGALWIVCRYIEIFLVPRRSAAYINEDVVVSKQEMKDVLMALIKRIQF